MTGEKTNTPKNSVNKHISPKVKCKLIKRHKIVPPKKIYTSNEARVASAIG